MKRKVLTPEFFDRPTIVVAKELLGKYLCRNNGGIVIARMITETEAYDGFDDLASHARFGITKRNTPMFAKAGTIYIYFTYGMHWMLNIVCREEKYPAAVLIRGLEHDPANMPPLNGPAKLTKFLKIDGSLNAQTLGKSTGLWVEDRGVAIPYKNIRRTPRIGVDYAGSWAKKPWRFVYRGAKGSEKASRRA